MPRRGVRVVAILALIAPAALAMSGCSPVSYPSLFPSVEEAPPQRTDTPMDANQIQQATEDLITDRNRLSAETQGGDQPAAAGSASKPAGATQNAGTPSAITPTADTAAK